MYIETQHGKEGQNEREREYDTGLRGQAAGQGVCLYLHIHKSAPILIVLIKRENIYSKYF